MLISVLVSMLIPLGAAWNCAPADVQSCLVSFETGMRAACATSDLACQCEEVLTKGAECFEGCPDEALEEFISNYADGVCQRAGELQLELGASSETSAISTTAGTSTLSETTKQTKRNHTLHPHTTHSTLHHSSITLSSTYHTHVHTNATQLDLGRAKDLLSNFTKNLTDLHNPSRHDTSPMKGLGWPLMAVVPISLILIII